MLYCSLKEGVVVKASELTKLAKKCGCYILQHGSRHDEWYSPTTGKTAQIPRHKGKEVATSTAHRIMTDLGLKG